MLGLDPWQTVLTAGTVTVIFSAIGGFKGVVYTDVILFFVAMGGAIGAAYYLVNLPEVGGIQALLANENVAGKISILPDFGNKEAVITLLIIPLAASVAETPNPLLTLSRDDSVDFISALIEPPQK